MNWDDLRFFLAAAKAGSLAEAARQLGSVQPTVGRRIAALEAALGLRLFQRHAQGLTLTEEGVRILEQAEAMGEAAAGLERLLSEEEPAAKGRVRISAPPGLAAEVIAPALAGFYDAFPGIEVVLQASAHSADLTHGEADVAIRLFRPAAADLVVRRIGTLRFGLYAAAAYLAQRGYPETEGALAQHRAIAYAELREAEENRWLEERLIKGAVALRSDCTFTRLRASQVGVGLAVLPHAIAASDKALVPLLPECELPSRPIWLVVHRDLRHVPRIRHVMDFLDALLGD